MSALTNGHKKIRTIVITGGPCGGKTTAMSWLQNALTSAGYAVIFLTETFTELANAGVSSYNCKDNFAFQRIQVRYQLERERLYRRAAEALANDNVVIVHDRGSMDDKPYMEPEEFAAILKELDQDEVSFRDKYDAVFHLVTAAKGALPFYTTANNTARTETPEEAIELDEKTLAAWAGHPHLRIIDNSTDFNGKMLRLLKEVMLALGEPEPMEHARRYLIKYPDLDWLNNNPNCQRVEIIQTYLTPYRDEERRICMRGTGGSYIYYKTTQRDAPDGGRMEVEERLSQEEYFTLLMEADPACRPIRKTRYCLVSDAQSFEVDLYPNWKDVAMLQIELSDPDAEVRIPEGLTVVREVTDNPAYDNHEMARL